MNPAYERNNTPVSREDFYKIACDPQRHVAVEACAGAGKTWMLVSRILRALLEGAAPQEVLAITFTKKAAGEMRQRLMEWLQEFAQASDEKLAQELRIRGVDARRIPELISPLRGLHRQLLSQGRTVQIRTFHSWFAALLRHAPLSVLEKLGLPAVYDLLEQDAPAIAQLWRPFQARLLREPEARPITRPWSPVTAAARPRRRWRGPCSGGWSSCWPMRPGCWRHRCRRRLSCAPNLPAWALRRNGCCRWPCANAGWRVPGSWGRKKTRRRRRLRQR